MRAAMKTLMSQSQAEAAKRISSILAAQKPNRALAKDWTVQFLMERYLLLLQNVPGVANIDAARLESVFQNAAVRLARTMSHVEFESATQYILACAEQVRLGLIRSITEDLPANSSETENEQGVTSLPTEDTRAAIERCLRLHKGVGNLSENDQHLMYLLWYTGVPVDQAALMLGISATQARTQYIAARIVLFEIIAP